MTWAPEWEKAAKRDHVRAHGSVSSCSNLPRPRSPQRRPEETNTGTLPRRRAGASRVEGVGPRGTLLQGETTEGLSLAQQALKTKPTSGSAP